MSAREVWCPTCHAERGQPCVEGGRPQPVEHPDRATAARTEAFAVATGGTTQPPRYRARWRR